jgi:coenzyme Q-binding protein COQ10
MTKHKEIRYSSYSPNQLHDLVIDIEQYPEFLPWCSAARILGQEDGFIYGELVISFKSFNGKYISKIESVMPDVDNDKNIIKVSLVEGPFKYLTNLWCFENDKQMNKTKITFEIDFCFNSIILQSLAGAVFKRALIAMMGAFEQRAAQVYENK